MKNPALIEMLNKKAGYDCATPPGAERLRHDIKTSTGEYIGLNTLKRILGILDYEGVHRSTIMDIIARYLDYPSWAMLERSLNDRISNFGKNDSIIDSAKLPTRCELEITWLPDRLIRLIHNHDNFFTVIHSINAKLQPGDSITLSQIAVGFPLYVSNVVRKGESLGTYSAAISDGISSIKLI